ncbi:MAG TPA: TraR/DksA C4-type zinc finger protein [Pseudonocardia sp.]|jgi:RNA polymerase-binding transcription factor DksA|uniref:TraR/DksA family transcriptional regulator n=1 Tax=Pseudonocardia sp. TaxID=60912 RepID=UPI002B4B4202|nr:TraR/DksA C4-type zinc finger protein [Pseudonocardia sp.]HLU54789.1 TraR/DksA C4-type zinc finger protein [Pseudonocardia sp.]
MDAVVSRARVARTRGRRRAELARYLPQLREALERQRAFRIEQLSSMAARARSHGAPTPQDDARAQVDALVAANAGRALADIELALSAMRTGRYGRCADCGADIAIEMLLAVPQTRWCLDCHRRRAEERRTGGEEQRT